MPGTTKFVKGWATPTSTGWDTAELQVAFAFGSAPFASSCADMLDRTWYAASTSVRNVRTFRGRTHDLDQFGPGSATIVLDNHSRLYDPTSTGTAFAGQILPGTPVKVQCKKPGEALTRTIWSGFAEGFELDYPRMTDATVTVRCVDAFKYLNLASISTLTTAAPTGTMIRHVLDGAGFPDTTGWRDLPVGFWSEQNYKGFRTPALEMCRNLADSEGGMVFMSRTGSFLFRTRDNYRNQSATTSAVFGDAGSSELPYTDFSLACDDYQLYNKVSVSRVRGPVQSTWSTESIGKYGARVLTKNNLLCPNSTSAKKLARWLVARYKEPGVRVGRLACKPRASTGDWELVSEAGPGTAVRVVRRPPGGGSTFSQLCSVEGVEHDISVGEDDWTLAFNMTPTALFPSSSL